MILEFVATLFIVWFLWYFVTTYLERRSMPPGPFPYPFIGNLLHLDSSNTKPFKTLRKKYGDIFTVTFAIGNTVVVNTASLARKLNLTIKTMWL
ncbi:ferruginol synthase, partial [Paramuricea clavata]